MVVGSGRGGERGLFRARRRVLRGHLLRRLDRHLARSCALSEWSDRAACFAEEKVRAAGGAPGKSVRHLGAREVEVAKIVGSVVCCGEFVDAALAAELEMVSYGERPILLGELRAGLGAAAEEAGPDTSLGRWFLAHRDAFPGEDLPENSGYLPV